MSFLESKKIELQPSFRRRFYRIVPLSSSWYWWSCPLPFDSADFVAGIGTQIAAVMGFVTNFYEMMTGGSYEAQFIPHLFVHNWSLAVEVHYYSTLGTGLLVPSPILQNSRSLRGSIFAVFVWFVYQLSQYVYWQPFRTQFSELCFSTWTHIYPFLVGSILATLTGIKQMTGLLKKIIRSWSLVRGCLVFCGGSGSL